MAGWIKNLPKENIYIFINYLGISSYLVNFCLKDTAITLITPKFE